MGLAKTVVKLETEEPSLRLAVLIDADNAQAAVIEGVLAEIARYGEAAVRRIYGDFTSPSSASWKKVLNQHSIKPVQQFAYTTGKNATDSTMIIDAMDLLYTRKFDGFCLVTSDSDFTGLAVRLREEGLQVFGLGERKTPEPFRNACHKFIFTEIFRQTTEEKAAPLAAAVVLSAAPTPPVTALSNVPGPAGAVPSSAAAQPFPRQFVLQALESAVDDTGWAHLGTFGGYLTKLQPDFDSRHYGFKKLSDLVKAKKDLFDTEERMPPGSQQKVLYLRAAAQASQP